MTDDGTPMTAAGQKFAAMLYATDTTTLDVANAAILAIEAEARALVTPDPTQPHGVSGLFHHAPGAPCVVCDRLVTPDPASDFDIEDLTAANLAAGEEARRANRAEAELAAIRAQGGGLDVERLVRAMERAMAAVDDEWTIPEFAEITATEYARLSEADPFGNHRLACGCLSDGNQTIMLCREHGQEAADYAD